MTYRLGVDIGTTFTAAAVANDGGTTMLGLGNRMLQVPSVLYLPADGGLVVGEAAERRAAVDPSRVVREFKRRIGDHVPMLVAGVPHSPQALTARLLHWVVEAATSQMGESPARVVLTYPANWGPYKRELLEQVVELADVGEVVTCTEPEAAAIQYAATRRVADGERIAMYDLGGGTFDTCVLQRQGERFALLGQPVGIEHLGGVDFDDAVVHHVVTALGDRMQHLDPADEGVATGLARLRRDCVEAKEALSSDTHTVVSVSMAGWSSGVRVTRDELENLIREPLEETVSAVGRAIRSAGLEPGDIGAVVLVGGGSRIPLVSELLHEHLQVRTAVDTHPKHDVALGAVQLGTSPSEVRPHTTARSIREPSPAGRVPARSEKVSGSASPQVEAALMESATSPASPGMASAPNSSSNEDGRARLPMRHRSLITVGIAAGLIIMAVVVFTRSARDPGADPTAGRRQTSLPAQPPSSAAPVRSLSIFGLPVSAPLTDEQVLIPLERAMNIDIYVATMSGSTTKLRPLISSPDSETSPSISPDRRSIVFVRQAAVGLPSLRVVAADGSGDRALFRSALPQCSSMSRPAWNPVDPDMLAIVCRSTKGKRRLLLVRLDGTVVRELDTHQKSMDDPAFSPDGTQVAYQASPAFSFDGGAIYRLPITGGTPTRVTDGEPGQDADPAWSPHGDLIVYRRRVDDGTVTGDFDIYQTPSAGSATPVAVVAGKGDDQDPSWSPDGDHLVFSSNRVGRAGGPGTTNLAWIVAADGSGMRPLWTAAARATLQGAPIWSRR